MTQDEYEREKCGRKNIFYTIPQARKAAKQFTLELGHRMYYYECQFCGYYHLSKLRYRRNYANTKKLV